MKREWWHGKTALQIYPKSFYDSNGDGIGDLPGITQKLDYLKSLGVDIVWISPVYRSPFVDQGYDISDYYDIDPVFGTMEDMDRLILEAKKRDMYILMDLVVNHCSSEHPLFKKALADPYGPYGKYFYFRRGKPNGKPPCNWRSYFGGSVWEKVPGYDNLWYLHMFAKEQPDLNWENPQLRQRVYRMINWWLDKGIAGFRIDAIRNIKKDITFEDFEPDRDDGLVSHMVMLQHAPGIGAFLTEMRDATFRKHNAISIAEAFDFSDSDLLKYVGEDGYFSSIFDFSAEILCRSRQGWFGDVYPSVNEVRDAYYASQQRIDGGGMFCNIVENHDEPRGASRYLPPEGQNDTGKKLLAVTMFMRRGLPFLYQGQEIGMTNFPFESIDQIEDIGTKNQYEVAMHNGLSGEEALAATSRFSRDNARTPMQWTGGENAGFTTGTPWFPVNPNYREINVEDEEKDPDSVLNFYRALSALRKDPRYAETIVYGSFDPILRDVDSLYAFYRTPEADSGQSSAISGASIPSGGRETGSAPRLLVLCNVQNRDLTITLPEDGFDEVILNNLHEFKKNGREVTLRPFQAVILNE